MAKPNIAIVDYGMGNIRSVANAIDEINGVEKLISDPSQLKDFDKVILPGVGAFEQAIQELKSSGMFEALNDFRSSGKMILGICLGMQLLCLDSTEDGLHEGLGWFDAHVTDLPKPEGFVIPHMGWNNVHFCYEDPILKNVDSGSDVYFVHSFAVHCKNSEDMLGESEYTTKFASIIHHENVYGMQFHPEKSQHVGLNLLRNFSEI